MFETLVSGYFLLSRFAIALFCGGLLIGFSGEAVKADCDFPPETVNIGAGEIHYDRAGIGPPVILLHGLFAEKEQWRNVLCSLAAAGFDAIALDLPGFGKSNDYPVTIYDLNRQVELLDSFREALGLK